MKKTLYTVEIECCEQIIFSNTMTKGQYEAEIKRLKSQCEETANDETITEYLGEEIYTTPMRKVTLTRFLRGTTFIDFEKSEWL